MKRAPCLSWLHSFWASGKSSKAKKGHQVSTESKQGRTYMPDGSRSSPAHALPTFSLHGLPVGLAKRAYSCEESQESSPCFANR